jgi:large subunit ribosomal protein L24
MVSKHTETKYKSPQGGIMWKKEAAIQISNISLIDPKTKKQLELELKEIRK